MNPELRTILNINGPNINKELALFEEERRRFDPSDRAANLKRVSKELRLITPPRATIAFPEYYGFMIAPNILDIHSTLWSTIIYERREQKKPMPTYIVSGETFEIQGLENITLTQFDVLQGDDNHEIIRKYISPILSRIGNVNVDRHFEELVVI